MARNEEEILLEMVRRFQSHCNSRDSWPSQSFKNRVKNIIKSYGPLTRAVLFEKFAKKNERKLRKARMY